MPYLGQVYTSSWFLKMLKAWGLQPAAVTGLSLNVEPHSVHWIKGWLSNKDIPSQTRPYSSIPGTIQSSQNQLFIAVVFMFLLEIQILIHKLTLSTSSVSIFFSFGKRGARGWHLKKKKTVLQVQFESNLKIVCKDVTWLTREHTDIHLITFKYNFSFFICS